jgi:guanylate kinase
MRIAKASVELTTAPQFDVIKNYDLDTALEAHQLVKSFVSK